MTTGTEKQSPEKTEGKKEITFLCKYCGQSRPLKDMRRIDRFCPPLIACRECEKRMR